MFRGFLVRDLTILVATVLLWVWSVDLEAETTLAHAVSITAGVGAAVCAYNFHEWGHLIAARLTDSVFTPARRLFSPFLFAYDDKENTPRQFVIMSLGGFAATAIYIGAFLAWMPRDQQAGITALRGAILLASLTVIIELPIFFRALIANTVPRTGVFKGPTVGGKRRPKP